MGGILLPIKAADHHHQNHEALQWQKQMCEGKLKLHVAAHIQEQEDNEQVVREVVQNHKALEKEYSTMVEELNVRATACHSFDSCSLVIHFVLLLLRATSITAECAHFPAV